MLAYIILICLERHPKPMPNALCHVVSVTSNARTAKALAEDFCRYEKKPDCADFLFVQKFRIENKIELARDFDES